MAGSLALECHCEARKAIWQCQRRLSPLAHSGVHVARWQATLPAGLFTGKFMREQEGGTIVVRSMLAPSYSFLRRDGNYLSRPRQCVLIHL